MGIANVSSAGAVPMAEILSADDARLWLNDHRRTPLCWLLWDRPAGVPFLCGVSASDVRVLAHLEKDQVRDGRIGLTWMQPELLDFVMAQPKGFLGVSLFPFLTLGQAKWCEHAIIGEFGTRENGGWLFNTRARRDADVAH